MIDLWNFCRDSSKFPSFSYNLTTLRAFKYEYLGGYLPNFTPEEFMRGFVHSRAFTN